jgi:hypothetical protein
MVSHLLTMIMIIIGQAYNGLFMNMRMKSELQYFYYIIYYRVYSLSYRMLDSLEVIMFGLIELLWLMIGIGFTFGALTGGCAVWFYRITS